MLVWWEPKARELRCAGGFCRASAWKETKINQFQSREILSKHAKDGANVRKKENMSN